MANLLTVRVSERCILAAGSWEERRDHNQNPYRLLAPPAPTMYEQLLATVVAAAVRFLPLPDVAIAPASDREKVRISDFFDLQQSKEALLPAIQRAWGEDFVAAKGPQVLGNAHALRAWPTASCSNSGETGRSENVVPSRPLTQRRIAPDDEKTLLAATTGRLVPLLRGLYRTITEKSAETLVEKLLPYALLFASPGDWSMTEETRACRLPEKEP